MSAVESGQWVWVDYKPQYAAVDDAAIQNAIGEANELILACIDSQYRESSDRLLTIAETYLAVSIICRIKSISSSSQPDSSGTENRARSLISLANLYRQEAFNLLSRYSTNSGALNSPSKA